MSTLYLSFYNIYIVDGRGRIITVTCILIILFGLSGHIIVTVLIQPINDVYLDITGALENISVIKSQVMVGFNMEGTLGSDPFTAADTLLSSFIAPASSGKTYKLLNAYSQVRNGHLAYIFEYIISKEVNGELVLNQHSVSVIMNRETELYTFTAIAPEYKWVNTERRGLIEAAESFRLVD